MNLSRRRGLTNPESSPPPVRAAPCRQPSKVRSSIEGLENRTLLSTITWDSADYPKGGSWDTPGNWIGDAVPTSTDTAVINLSSGGTVTTGPSDSVLSLSTNASTTVSVSNGSLTKRRLPPPRSEGPSP